MSSKYAMTESGHVVMSLWADYQYCDGDEMAVMVFRCPRDVRKMRIATGATFWQAGSHDLVLIVVRSYFPQSATTSLDTHKSDLYAHFST